MRDPKRIRKFCERLATAWECYPDQRFGQVIFNVVSEMGRDPFYVEDDEMISIIEKYFGISKEEAKCDS